MDTDYAVDQFSEQRRPLFDTIQVAQGAAIPAAITFFGHTKGTDGEQITNLQEAFKIPPPGDFEAYSLRMVAIGCGKADLLSLMKGYNFYLCIGPDDALVTEGPLEYWPGGAGVHGMAATTAVTTTIENWLNGLPDPRAVILFDPPIHISAGELFKVVGRGTSPGNAVAAIFLRCYLDGKRRKGLRA
jgi:hypothetical protein